MENIVNAAPRVYATGVDDQSIHEKLYERIREGIHIPMVYFWAETGPTDAQLVYGNTFELTYGAKTLDGRSKYANHVTPFLVDVILPNGCNIVAKRLLPRDIGPKASIRISVDMVAEEFDEYEREIGGSFKRDTSNNYVTTGAKVQGYLIKFIKEVIPTDPVTKETEFHKGKVHTGTMTNSKGVNSTVYPLIDFIAPHFGAKGNNFGFRIYAPTTEDLNPVKIKLFEEDNVYPFRLNVVRRNNEAGNSIDVKNFYGEINSDFCLKPDMVDTSYNKERYLEHIAVEEYQNLNPYGTEPLKYGPFGHVKLYDDNITYVLEELLKAEAQVSYPTNSLHGKGTDPEKQDHYLVNLFGLENPDGSPYQTLRFDHSTLDSLRFTENTTIWLEGASDGTMTDQEFADLVELELAEMNDPDSRYQDIIAYPFTAFWDSGFPLSTKYKMGYVISQRKDTNVYVSNYISGERPLTTSEESSRHIAIVERLRAFIESEYFATKTFRAVNVSCSSKLLSSTWRKRVPCLIELANMITNMAAGYSFKGQYVFDRPPNNVFSLTGDVSNTWAPRSVRYRDWAMGMMYPENLEQRVVYFPASHTVYKEDASVLTSVINAVILAQIERVGMIAQKQFSGRITTQNILKEEIEEWVTERLENRFAGLCRIEPHVYFTDADNARGYSWTLKIIAHLPNMYTVETLIVEARRLNDIQPGNQSFVS